MKKNIFILAAVFFFAVSCSTTTRLSQYPKMYEEKPLTLLVMPPINNTSNVEAKELLYTSISKPLAEAGYYLISPHLALDVLKAESAYDSEMFVDAPLDKFGQYFGCDAVVFSEIEKWTKSGFSIFTKIRYFIKSVKDNEIIFDRTCDLQLDLSQNSGTGGAFGALLDLAASALVTASTDHIVAARKANIYIFSDIPRGKYSPMYGKDQNVEAKEKNISAVVK